jgi:hypothetical protein
MLLDAFSLGNLAICFHLRIINETGRIQYADDALDDDRIVEEFSRHIHSLREDFLVNATIFRFER